MSFEVSNSGESSNTENLNDRFQELEAEEKGLFTRLGEKSSSLLKLLIFTSTFSLMIENGDFANAENINPPKNKTEEAKSGDDSKKRDLPKVENNSNLQKNKIQYCLDGETLNLMRKNSIYIEGNTLVFRNGGKLLPQEVNGVYTLNIDISSKISNNDRDTVFVFDFTNNDGSKERVTAVNGNVAVYESDKDFNKEEMNK